MNPMNKLIDKLISEAPEADKGGVACQVIFKSATQQQQVVGGVLKKLEGFEDLYSMTVIGTAQRDAQSPPQAFHAEIYFEAESILRIEVVKPIENPSGLIIPSGGNGRVIPPSLRSL
jgi:hypothetical protein